MVFSIILINPNTPGSYRKASIPTVSLGIAAIYSYVKQYSDENITIIDARCDGLSPLETFAQLKTIKPSVVGISLCVHESSGWTVELIDLIKELDSTIHITLGNYFPSLFPEKAFELIPRADSIVVGEGEVTFFELISAIKEQKDWRVTEGLAYQDGVANKIILNPRRALIEDLDQLPWAYRYMAKGDGSDMEVEMEGTRGCFFSCSFCSVSAFYGLSLGKKLRLRSAKNIYDEMSALKKKFPNLVHFRFVDPDFISATCRARSENFAKLFIESSMSIQFQIDARASSILKNIPLLKLLKQAGLVRIYLGVESGSEYILSKMNKLTKPEENIEAARILKALDIDCTYGFIMITPWSRDEDIEQNIRLLEKIGHVGIHNVFHEMTLIPGTAAFDEMKKAGRLIWKGKLYYFSYQTSSERIERLRKLRQVLEKERVQFFANLSFIYESIRRVKWAGEINRAERIEKASDKLSLDIFKFCWQKIADNQVLNQQDYAVIAKGCYKKFQPEVNKLLRLINPKIPIPCSADLLPHGLPARQV